MSIHDDHIELAIRHLVTGLYGCIVACGTHEGRVDAFAQNIAAVSSDSSSKNEASDMLIVGQFLTELGSCLRDVVQAKTMPYEDYLKTYHWKVLRQQALAHHGGSCCLCVLCKDCHSRFHDKIQGK